MENYDRIILVNHGKGTDITYEEYVMYMASPEKDWYRIDFQLGDRRHRLDGPAVEYANGAKFWFVNDKSHRLDGPAIIWETGAKAWYVDGKRYLEQDYSSAVAAYIRTHTHTSP